MNDSHDPVIPEVLAITAAGSSFYEGVAVIVRFGMRRKNDFFYLTFLDNLGNASITKTDYLDYFIGLDEHLLRDVLGLRVIAGQAGGGGEDHVLISTHEDRELRRGGRLRR